MTRLLDVDQVADAVGLSPLTVRRALRAGELRGMKIRSRWRVDPVDLAAWTEGCRPDVQAALAARPGLAPRVRATVPDGGFRALANAERRRAS